MSHRFLACKYCTYLDHMTLEVYRGNIIIIMPNFFTPDSFVPCYLRTNLNASVNLLNFSES